MMIAILNIFGSTRKLSAPLGDGLGEDRRFEMYRDETSSMI